MSVTVQFSLYGSVPPSLDRPVLIRAAMAEPAEWDMARSAATWHRAGHDEPALLVASLDVRGQRAGSSHHHLDDGLPLIPQDSRASSPRSSRRRHHSQLRPRSHRSHQDVAAAGSDLPPLVTYARMADRVVCYPPSADPHQQDGQLQSQPPDSSCPSLVQLSGPNRTQRCDLLPPNRRNCPSAAQPYVDPIFARHRGLPCLDLALAPLQPWPFAIARRGRVCAFGARTRVKSDRPLQRENESAGMPKQNLPG